MRRLILGKELSMRLGVFLGDSINVVSPVGPIKSFTMTPKIRPYTVVGILESGMFEYDSSLSYISLKEAQKFFATAHKWAQEVETFSPWTQTSYEKMAEIFPDKFSSIKEKVIDGSYLSHRLKIDENIKAITK